MKNDQLDIKLFKGVFPFRTGIERIYAHAKTRESAKTKMFFRLSKKHGVPIEQVYGLFNGHETYNIEIDKEWREKQNGRIHQDRNGEGNQA